MIAVVAAHVVAGDRTTVTGLNPNKAIGPDDIPARILQITVNELAPAMQIIFQKSLDTEFHS